MSFVVCSNNAEIALPTKDATLDQYREQGIVVGREYFRWWNEQKLAPDAPTGIWTAEFMLDYLLKLNNKMQPMFAPSPEQIEAFNVAAMGEWSRLVHQQTLQIEAFAKLAAAGTAFLQTLIPRDDLLSSTAVADNVVPFTKH